MDACNCLHNTADAPPAWQAIGPERTLSRALASDHCCTHVLSAGLRLGVQVMMMVGVNPVSDALGRVNKLEVIPLEELGRPRIDVVVNCSGVFRDLFVNQMNLLDRAIKMAAEQDEPEDMNFVRKHAREQVRACAAQTWLHPSPVCVLNRALLEKFCVLHACRLTRPVDACLFERSLLVPVQETCCMGRSSGACLCRCSQAEELGTSLREAATRVFSNASGSYSSNVNLAVENSSWQDEQQLQEMYLKRKSFAFNSDRYSSHPEHRRAGLDTLLSRSDLPQAFCACLKRHQTTGSNVSSHAKMPVKV